MSSNGNFSRTDADASIARIDHSKLSWCYALDGVVTIDVETAICGAREEAGAPSVGVAHFEGDIDADRRRPRVACEEVETCDVERATVLEQIVVAMRNIESVLC